jgi:hypothetical protein
MNLYQEEDYEDTRYADEDDPPSDIRVATINDPGPTAAQLDIRFSNHNFSLDLTYMDAFSAPPQFDRVGPGEPKTL